MRSEGLVDFGGWGAGTAGFDGFATRVGAVDATFVLLGRGISREIRRYELIMDVRARSGEGRAKEGLTWSSSQAILRKVQEMR